MNMKKKTWLTGAALAVVAALAGTASAAGVGSPSELNIDVTITASLSVSVVNQRISSQTVSWSGTPDLQFASASSATVKNDSGILTERWKLSSGASQNGLGNAATWVLGTSTTTPGADTFALQAVFGSSNTVLAGCPATGATDWNNGTNVPLLTAVGVQYTATVFADATLNNNGTPNPDNGTFQLFSNSQRALCWKLTMPDSTSTTDQQIVQVVVTAF